MKTSRRGFLAFLSTLPLARALGSKGPALWNPHPAQKEFLLSQDMRIPLTIVPGGRFSGSDIVAAELERVSQHIPLLFERDDAFFSALETREQAGTRRRGHGRGRSQRGRRG